MNFQWGINWWILAAAVVEVLEEGNWKLCRCHSTHWSALKEFDPGTTPFVMSLDVLNVLVLLLGGFLNSLEFALGWPSDVFNIYLQKLYAKATFSNAFFYNAVVWPHSFLSCFVLLLARTDTMSSFSVLLWGFHCNLIDTHIIVNFQKHGHGTPSQFTDSDNSENTQSTSSRKKECNKQAKFIYYCIIPVFVIQTSCLTIDTQKSKKGEKIRAEIWLWKQSWIACKGLAFCLLTFNWQSESFFATGTS
jgi:hypothetical protein